MDSVKATSSVGTHGVPWPVDIPCFERWVRDTIQPGVEVIEFLSQETSTYVSVTWPTNDHAQRVKPRVLQRTLVIKGKTTRLCSDHV